MCTLERKRKQKERKEKVKGAIGITQKLSRATLKLFRCNKVALDSLNITCFRAFTSSLYRLLLNALNIY